MRQGPARPPALLLAYDKVGDLRYGENPYQKAALYHEPFPFAATATAEKLQGKELSYNNLIDLDAALRLATEFDRPAAVVINTRTRLGWPWRRHSPKPIHSRMRRTRSPPTA